MEKIIEVGSISFFVTNSVYDSGQKLSNNDREFLAKELEEKFLDEFSKSPASDVFTITSVKWEPGCILETFFVGVAIGVALIFINKIIDECMKHPEKDINPIEDLTHRINGTWLSLNGGWKNSRHLVRARKFKFSDPVEKLRQLKKMRSENLITESEYIEKKDQILKEI